MVWYGMVWYGMVNVDLYSAIVTKASNALNTLVPIGLEQSQIVRQRFPDHWAVHGESSTADSGYPMSWHHHQLLCGGPETLPADNILMSLPS